MIGDTKIRRGKVTQAEDGGSKDTFGFLGVALDKSGRNRVHDCWCPRCFEHISNGDEQAHRNDCRPNLPNIETLRNSGAQVDETSYVDEKAFKCSKAITKHLA